jgi:hypothetical protein
MKTLISPHTPSWVKRFLYGITIFCSLICFGGGLIVGLIATLVFNAIPFFALMYYQKRDLYGWRKSTLKDPFFQNGSFNVVSNGEKSFIAVSSFKVTIVNINTIIVINRKTFSLLEIYKNYPKIEKQTTINGYNLYNIDIPTAEISEVNQINQGEAGWPFAIGKNMNYGIRIKAKDGTIYDVDTQFPKEICAEINKSLSK